MLPSSPGTPITARNSPLTPQMLTKEPVARSVDPGLAGVIRLSREERLLAAKGDKAQYRCPKCTGDAPGTFGAALEEQLPTAGKYGIDALAK